MGEGEPTIKSEEQLRSEFNRLVDLILELPVVFTREGKKEAAISSEFLDLETVYFEALKKVSRGELPLGQANILLRKVLEDMKSLGVRAGIVRARLMDSEILPYEH